MKTSYTGMFRAGMYGATIVLPAKDIYDQRIAAGQTPSEAANAVMKGMTGINPNTNQFDWDQIKHYYGPVICWSILDTVASKAGVYRKIGRLVKNLGV